jgi:hypothetical protein
LRAEEYADGGGTEDLDAGEVDLDGTGLKPEPGADGVVTARRSGADL